MIPALLLTILVVCGYFVWMAITAFKRRWRRLVYQAVVGLCLAGLLYGGAMLWWKWDGEREAAAFHEGLFGVKGRFPDPLFAFNPQREFNGDGYSLEVFPLPPEVRTQFEHFAAAQMAGRPKRPEYRSHWKQVDWQPSPLRAEDKQYLDFVLPNAAETTEQCMQIRQVLTKPGAYYGYFYYGHEGWLGDVDFFIVDLDGGRIYLINLNT